MNNYYRIAVYFCSTNYRTDPKLCGTALYTLNIGPFNIFRNVDEVMPSKSSKFCGIIFLCCRVITILVFVLTCIVDLRLK